MAKLRVDKIAAPIVKDEFTGSVYFDGTGDYLSLSSNTDFAMGTGDFTAECFINATSFSNAEGSYSERVFDSNTGQLGIYVTSDGSGTIGALVSGTDHRGNNSPTLSGWTHVALTRSGSTVRIFLNGVLDSSFTNSGSVASSGDFLIGARASGQGGFLGYISNFRICKGHAVYTGNFTPPTRELPVHKAPPKGVVFPAADNVTVLLACQSSTDATADSSGRHTITANGNAHAQSANPGLFRKTNITSTITENTGSVYFDNSGDYLVPPVDDDELILGDTYSVEWWHYLSEIGTADKRHGFIMAASAETTTTNESGGLAIYTENDGSQQRLRVRANNTGSDVTTPTGDILAGVWQHCAVQVKNNACEIYIDGVLRVSGNTNGSVTQRIRRIGSVYFTNTDYDTHGYISNLRICKGHVVYTSQFIPPTRELEVHVGSIDDRTVLLCCYDGENIFAEKTGRILRAVGDRISSPTPTATDSPIGITTNNPGLTRNVDPTDGPTFQGGAGFVSQNWLTLPKGTTTERMPVFGGDQSGTRGFFAGGYNPTRTDVINYVTVPTLGNAIDFGNLGAANGGPTGFSDSTRGWIAGGNINPTITNVMEYVTIASSGNAVDGGDLITATGARPGSVANSIRGVIAGGSTPGQVRTIVHHTIQTTGIVQDFGDLTEVKSGVSGVMSPTRGVFAGGSTPSGRIDTIEHITIASTGNAVLFGELSLDDRSNMGGASNTVRGLFGGGRSPTDHTHIEYITIATLGNGQDFGDLTQSNMDGDVGAVSNSTRVVFGGGASDELGYVEIATLGNTTQFGKFTVNTTSTQDPACFSNGHGGLG